MRGIIPVPMSLHELFHAISEYEMRRYRSDRRMYGADDEPVAGHFPSGPHPPPPTDWYRVIKNVLTEHHGKECAGFTLVKVTDQGVYLHNWGWERELEIDREAQTARLRPPGGHLSVFFGGRDRLDSVSHAIDFIASWRLPQAYNLPVSFYRDVSIVKDGGDYGVGRWIGDVQVGMGWVSEIDRYREEVREAVAKHEEMLACK